MSALPKSAARSLGVGANAIGLVAMAIIFAVACMSGYASWAQGFRVMESFSFPEWWLYAVACGALLLMVIEFGLRLWRGLTGFRARRDEGWF